jgi:hypothetical protein
LAAILVFHGSTDWAAPASYWLTPIFCAIGILLAAGLFTPFAAIAGVVVGAAALGLCKCDDPITGAFLVVVTAAAGMLGAGAYSLDARIYGRREVVVPTRRDE